MIYFLLLKTKQLSRIMTTIKQWLYSKSFDTTVALFMLNSAGSNAPRVVSAGFMRAQATRWYFVSKNTLFLTVLKNAPIIRILLVKLPLPLQSSAANGDSR